MKNLKVLSLLLLAAGLLAVSAGQADAQRRGARRPAVRPSIVVVGGYWYPRYDVNPRFAYGYPWGPFGVYPPYGYAYDGRDDRISSIRLQVKPVETQVFVDGYAAGEVDEYDGIFQRLRLRPGPHEIVLYLDGYRTIRRDVYANPGSDRTFRFDMAPLGPGETAELPSPPGVEPRGAGGERSERRGADERSPGGRPAERPPVREPAARFGTLSVRLQPDDAELLIDGARWDAPGDQFRLAVRLAEGRHHVEVRKAGYATYLEDVLIRPNATLSLDVSLLRDGAAGR